ncbi:MAG: glycosyltransferase family 9 protein [Candidatus Omnitrophica bacterium]|nr:glycosyltransferase family 9 protein [Candidatus Omnitrophota bacterium]
MLKPRRILLVRTDRIGELLLTTPAFGSVRESFPGAKITLLVKPSSSPVVEGNPCFDSIVKLDPVPDLDSFAKRLRFIRFLRVSGFDMVVIFNPSKFFNVAAFLAGIPVRVGYDRKLGFLLTRSIEDKKYLCEKHEVEYNLDLAKAAGAVILSKKLCFPLAETDERAAAEILARNGITGGGFAAVHPGTSNPEKLWPAERFAQVCDKMIDAFRIKAVLVGGEDERSAAAEVKSKMRNEVTDLTGKLALKESGALLKRSALLISCDSGPVHIASAMGTPVIALFGEARPGGSSKRWGPYGQGQSPAAAGHIVVGRRKVTDITVDNVFEAVSGKLCKKP